ncbi:hypothetical protein HDU93_004732, partial [Gonapodya sp. JEL0774]
MAVVLEQEKQKLTLDISDATVVGVSTVTIDDGADGSDSQKGEVSEDGVVTAYPEGGYGWVAVLTTFN